MTTQGADTARETGMAQQVEQVDGEIVAEMLVALEGLVGLVAAKHPQQGEWTQQARDVIAKAKGEPVTRECADCGAVTVLDDLTSDGRCETCIAACTCVTCGADVEPEDGVDAPVCGDCAEPEESYACSLCHDTGIGQSGDPDTSYCGCAWGGRQERDPDAAYDRAREGDW